VTGGILTSHPSQGAIRLVVGADGLLLVQSLLALEGGLVGPAARPLMGTLTFLAFVATVAAIIGDRTDHDRPWRHRDDA